MAEKTLSFYAVHDSGKNDEVNSALIFQNKNNLNYPCLIFVRINSWNDYSFYTNFLVFYFHGKNNYTNFGVVKIIQYQAKDFYTTLPENFEELKKDEFFSRGTLPFYNNLKLVGFKNNILSSINDIHYNNYNREDILKIGDGSLLYPYQNSLFREDFYDLEVSSEYAKNSFEMLTKIQKCETSLSGIDGEEKEIIRKLLYGSVITCLESYLGDSFKFHVINNKNYFYSFLKNYDFPKGEMKYDLSELGLKGNEIGEFIEKRVREIMNTIIFHNIRMTKEIYKKILNIELPDKIIDFQEDIQKRHDIFHRNGKNIAGEDISISNEEMSVLITKVQKFIGNCEHILETRL